MIDPFANDHQSQQIGDLIIENQTDKVIMYGDIDITKTKTGLDQALQLQALLNDIVKTLLQAQQQDPQQFKDSADTVMAQQQNRKSIDNPFS